MEYNFKEGRNVKEAHDDLVSAFGKKAVSLRNVKRYYNRFEMGSSAESSPTSAGRPKSVNVAKFEEIIKSEPTLGLRELSTRTGASKSAVHRALHQLGFKWLWNK